MKKDIHPEYVPAKIICACGNIIDTRSTVPEINISICSNCHPFFTGKQKFVDEAGRIEKFRRKYGIKDDAAETESAAEESAEDTPAED